MLGEKSSTIVKGLDLRDIPKRGRSPKYPWEEWFNGYCHRLVQGEHYEAESPKSFRSTVYSAAERLGIKVHTKIIDGDLHVQADVPQKDDEA